MADSPYVQILEEVVSGGSGSAPSKAGLFSATLFSQLGPEAAVTQGPQGCSIDESISWGRSQSAHVLVSVADGSGGGAWFSAGDESPALWEVGRLLPWPAEGGLDAARRFAARARTGFADRSGRTWFVQMSVLGDAAAPEGFTEYWVEAVETDVAIIELLGVSPVAACLPAEVVERLAEDEQNFYARIYEPTVARVFVVISAASQPEAQFIGEDVASRQAARVLGELDTHDFTQRLSFRADAHRFETYPGGTSTAA